MTGKNPGNFDIEKKRGVLAEDWKFTSGKNLFFLFTLQVLTADVMEKSMSAEDSASTLWKTCKLSRENGSPKKLTRNT